MAFDLTKSYSQDFEFVDFVEDTTWEIPGDPDPTQVTGMQARWGDFDTPDLVSLAAGLGLGSEAAAVVIWQPEVPEVEDEEELTPFAPKTGHVLRREERGNEGWVIIGVKHSRFGHWLCACEKEVTNAG